MEKKLIRAVKNRPALYNIRHEQYKNIKMREKLWQEVASIVGETMTKCRQRWKSLRERARREMMQPNGMESRSAKAWRYFEMMKFLKDTFDHKANRNKSINETVFVDEFKQEYFEIIEPYQDEMPPPEQYECPAIMTLPTNEQQWPQAPQSPTPSSASTPSCSKKKQNEDGALVKAVDSFSNLVSDIRTQYIQKPSDSPMLLFFKNLEIIMKGKYTCHEELELQQALLDVYIKKTKEFEARKKKRQF